ncbi:MAG TPA: ABC transporter substrate-binding protein, partial [Dehalococcoidia bacterium]|nr:ABC transporter substrate-binding protein [Dehalococcoidia bacterium]
MRNEGWLSTPGARRITRRRALGLAGAGVSLSPFALAACGGSSSSGSNARAGGSAGSAGAGTPSTGAGSPALGASGTAAAASKPPQYPYAFQLPDETAAAVPGGTYRDYFFADITGTLDPNTTASRSSVLWLTDQVYERLLRFDTGSGKDPTKPLQVIPHLAASFEVPSDGSQYIFKLRPGVKFWNVAPVNGREMDMDDWKLSLAASVASSYVPSAALIFDLKNPQFPDAQTMVLKTNFPYAPGPGLFTSGPSSFYVMPKEGFGGGSLDFKNTVLGTGYNQFVSYQPSISYEFKKHDSYWQAGRPFIDKKHTPVIPEYANQMAQFVTGNILIFQPNQTDVLQARKDAAGAVLERAPNAGGLTVSYFGFQELDTAPWKDPRVRQAISMVIDRKSRLDYFTNASEFQQNGLPIATKLNTHFSGGSYFWQDAQTGQLGDASIYLQYNVAEAKKLLAAAGFPDGIDIDCYAHTGLNYGPQYPESAQIMVDMMTMSGLFRVNFHKIPYADWLPTIYQTRNYKGLAMAHPGFGGNGDNDISLWSSYHTASGQQFRGIKDSQLEMMIDNQRRELDPDKRTGLMHDIQKYLAQTMP